MYTDEHVAYEVVGEDRNDGGALDLRGWRVGSIAGIDLEINFTWLFLFALMAMWLAGDHFPGKYPQAAPWEHLTAGLLATVLLFVSVVLHEVAHSLAARQYGVGVSRITLFIFGGVAQTDSEPRTAISELVIAIAGPLCSVAIAAVAYGVGWALQQGGTAPVWSGLFAVLGLVNLMLAGFNILPAFPLDGGRVLRASLWYLTDNLLRSTYIATLMGRGLGYLLIGMGVYSLLFERNLSGLYLVGMGWLLGSVAAGAYQTARVQAQLHDVSVRQLMRPAPALLQATDSVQTAIDSYLRPHQVAALPVVYGDRIVGILRAREVEQVDPANWPYLPVHQLMTPLDPLADVVGADTGAFDALAAMSRDSRDYLLVADSEGIAGTVTVADLTGPLRGVV